jgi:hypothetical protein
MAPWSASRRNKRGLSLEKVRSLMNERTRSKNVLPASAEVMCVQYVATQVKRHVSIYIPGNVMLYQSAQMFARILCLCH